MLEERLQGAEYDAGKAPEVTEGIVSALRIKLKGDLKMPRYKLGIKVVMGELKG